MKVGKHILDRNKQFVALSKAEIAFFCCFKVKQSLHSLLATLVDIYTNGNKPVNKLVKLITYH